LVVWSLLFDVAISKACCHFLEIYSSPPLWKNNEGENFSLFIFENHNHNTWATLAKFILFLFCQTFPKKNVLCHKFNQKIIKANNKLEPTSCANKII
jgi:hypothetical protein